jgi:hypothetical protein
MEPPPVNYLKRYDDEPEPTKFALLRRLIPRCRILCVNGTHLGLAKLHVAHSKDENSPCEWV